MKFALIHSIIGTFLAANMVMHYYFSFIVGLIFSLSAFSQEEAQIICMCDSEAQFPGGYAEMNRYIITNLELPKDIDSYVNPTTRLYISFTVTETGKIADVTVDRGISPEIDAAFVKVIKGMPDWIPHTFGCGDEDATRVRLPFTIHLN